MAGETTSLAAGAWKDANVFPVNGKALMIHEATASFGTTDNQTNDVMEVCYLPAGIKVYGLIVSATDMDTDASPAVVHKVTVGSTDVVTGLTNGQAGTTTVHGIAPYTTTGYTLVKVTSTTAAATAAAGTMTIRFLYTQS